MLISKAYAAAAVVSDVVPVGATAPSPMQAFMWNMGLVMILVALFYVLLIMPQQRRFKEHSVMLSGLKKGDKIVTAGGIVGVIEKIVDDNDVILDLGNGIKVTAVRSTIQRHTAKPSKPANDQSNNQKSEEKK